MPRADVFVKAEAALRPARSSRIRAVSNPAALRNGLVMIWNGPVRMVRC